MSDVIPHFGHPLSRFTTDLFGQIKVLIVGNIFGDYGYYPQKVKKLKIYINYFASPKRRISGKCLSKAGS